MQSRSTVRTNVIIFTILGLVVALLIHFLVLSSPRYNWLDNDSSWFSTPSAFIDNTTMLVLYLRALII
ncbi:MAG: light-harvesting protein [Chloroflexaceae bacterium]|nr:light-harvesting protein [Chloroflexaceae bacterium]